MFPNTKLIDGNLGVAKRVKEVLEENNLLSTNSKGTIEFIISKQD